MLKVRCKGCQQILTANHEVQKCVCEKIWVEPVEENDNFRCGWVTEGTTFHDNMELLNEDGSEFVVPVREEVDAAQPDTKLETRDDDKA